MGFNLALKVLRDVYSIQSSVLITSRHIPFDSELLTEIFYVYHSTPIAFKGRDPVRTKIVIDNNIIEEVNLFNYLGNMITCEGELDINNKLDNFLKISDILNNVFRPQKTLKKTRIKI